MSIAEFTTVHLRSTWPKLGICLKKGFKYVILLCNSRKMHYQWPLNTLVLFKWSVQMFSFHLFFVFAFLCGYSTKKKAALWCYYFLENFNRYCNSYFKDTEVISKYPTALFLRAQKSNFIFARNQQKSQVNLFLQQSGFHSILYFNPNCMTSSYLPIQGSEKKN